jgi:peptidoglycan/xylan/chitin deacetylase (PgdA/CDA1 family)
LSALRRARCTFVDGTTALAILQGRRRCPPRAVLVTFDDSYANFESHALPVLRASGVPSVLFAVTGLSDNRWDVLRGGSPQPLLSPTRLAALGEEPDVEIALHTRTHPDLAILRPGEVGDELRGAREDLVRAGVRHLPMLAYPYGSHAASVREEAERAGYDAAFTIEPGRAIPPVDLMMVPRLMVMADWGIPEMLLRLWLGERRPPASPRDSMSWGRRLRHPQ